MSTDNNKPNKVEPIFSPYYEGKPSRKFIAKFEDSSGVFLPSFVVYAIDRPKFQITRSDNHVPKYTWLPINVKLYDPVAPSSSQSIMSHLGRNEPFTITVDLIGDAGQIVEKWKILDANICFVDFDTLNWTEDDNSTIEQPNVSIPIKGAVPLTISLTVTYSYAQLIF